MYKRQGDLSLLVSRWNIERHSEEGIILYANSVMSRSTVTRHIHISVPVSYTHLDVYKRQDFEMNADTSGLAVAGRIGTWHTIDQHEVSGHSFYLMEHDTYGDEAACIIVDERGKLVLDDV